MNPDPETEELRLAQISRLRSEREQAEQSGDESERKQHDRRAERAGYLAEKLQDRAVSERGRS